MKKRAGQKPLAKGHAYKGELGPPPGIDMERMHQAMRKMMKSNSTPIGRRTKRAP